MYNFYNLGVIFSEYRIFPSLCNHISISCLSRHLSPSLSFSFIHSLPSLSFSHLSSSVCLPSFALDFLLPLSPRRSREGEGARKMAARERRQRSVTIFPSLQQLSKSWEGATSHAQDREHGTPTLSLYSFFILFFSRFGFFFSPFSVCFCNFL